MYTELTKKGFFIIPCASNVNCEETYALVKNDLGNIIKVTSVVTHVEYKIIINNVCLRIDREKDTILYKSSDVSFSCLPQKKDCKNNLESYFWKFLSEKSSLFQIQFTSGYLLHTSVSTISSRIYP